MALGFAVPRFDDASPDGRASRPAEVGPGAAESVLTAAATWPCLPLALSRVTSGGLTGEGVAAVRASPAFRTRQRFTPKRAIATIPIAPAPIVSARSRFA